MIKINISIKNSYPLQLQQHFGMIHERLRTNSSLILTPGDLERSSMLRSSTFNFFKSGSNSPSSSHCGKSQRDSTLEEDLVKLSEDLSIEKEKNQCLVHENSTLINENHVSNVLTNQLEVEKRKLVREMRNINEKYQNVQKEKIDLIAEVGGLKSQITCLTGSIQISEEQIFALSSENRKLIEKVNFEKETAADLKKDNLFLRAQIQNILNNYVKTVKELNENMLDLEIVDKINLKVKEIQGKIEVLRVEVQGIEVKQKGIFHIKNQFINYTEKLKQRSSALQNQMSLLRSKNTVSDQLECQELKVKLLRIQNDHKEQLRKKADEVEDLKADIIDLQRKYEELEDELSSKWSSSLPQFHTNTQYLNKVIKENFRETQHSKEVMDKKNEQIQKLKEQLLEEENITRNKVSEIQRLENLLKYGNRSQEFEFQKQLDQQAQENKRLGRKIEQLTEKQQTLKDQIAEKDKIILNYVQRKK